MWIGPDYTGNAVLRIKGIEVPSDEIYCIKARYLYEILSSGVVKSSLVHDKNGRKFLKIIVRWCEFGQSTAYMLPVASA